jgi:hypothetical protein
MWTAERWQPGAANNQWGFQESSGEFEIFVCNRQVFTLTEVGLKQLFEWAGALWLEVRVEE